MAHYCECRTGKVRFNPSVGNLKLGKSRPGPRMSFQTWLGKLLLCFFFALNPVLFFRCYAQLRFPLHGRPNPFDSFWTLASASLTEVCVCVNVSRCGKKKGHRIPKRAKQIKYPFIELHSTRAYHLSVAEVQTGKKQQHIHIEIFVCIIINLDIIQFSHSGVPFRPRTGFCFVWFPTLSRVRHRPKERGFPFDAFTLGMTAGAIKGRTGHSLQSSSAWRIGSMVKTHCAFVSQAQIRANGKDQKFGIFS